MSKENTRAALLEAGMRIFYERGYNNSGIESILQAVGVPKGSFYYYFSSKEEFGLEVINRFAEEINTRLEASLGDQSLSPLERLRRHYELKIEKLESLSCRNGCLVGTLSQEMANQSERFRARLEEIFESWVDRYADCLRQAQEAGEIPAHLDPRELAEFWLNSWQGAVLKAKTIRSIAPLRIFLHMMFGYVLHQA